MQFAAGAFAFQHTVLFLAEGDTVLVIDSIILIDHPDGGFLEPHELPGMLRLHSCCTHELGRFISMLNQIAQSACLRYTLDEGRGTGLAAGAASASP